MRDRGTRLSGRGCFLLNNPSRSGLPVLNLKGKLVYTPFHPNNPTQNRSKKQMSELEFKTAPNTKDPGFRENTGLMCALFYFSFCHLLCFLKVMNHLALLFPIEDYHLFPCEHSFLLCRHQQRFPPDDLSAYHIKCNAEQLFSTRI